MNNDNDNNTSNTKEKFADKLDRFMESFFGFLAKYGFIFMFSVTIFQAFALGMSSSVGAKSSSLWNFVFLVYFACRAFSIKTNDDTSSYNEGLEDAFEASDEEKEDALKAVVQDPEFEKLMLSYTKAYVSGKKENIDTVKEEVYSYFKANI